ncbi:MAG: ABC transporter ATP-binding protein [Lachnospiraceae bacterium]|nr:ABC transporter ATP-binding protein [Lachnospiraceae bacterium]
MTDNKKSKNMTTLFKVLRFIGRYRFLLILSILLACTTVVIQLYVPILFGNAIDQVVAAHQVHFHKMLYFLGRVTTLIVLSSILTWIMNMINNRMTYHTVKDIRSKAIQKISHLPLSYLDAHSTGDIVSRVIADTDILSDGLLLGFTQLFSGIVTIIVTLAFMLSKNIWITLLVVVLTPLSFFVAKFVSSHSYEMFHKQSDTRGKQTALIEEMIGNQRIVHAFGYESTASERFAQINEDLKEYSQKAVFYSSLTNPSTRFVNNIIYAGVALLGAILVPYNMLTIGGLSVMLAYANQYMKPFNDISSVVTELQNALACASRIFEILEAETESKEPEKELTDITGKVEIHDVAFSYDPSKELIRDFNLSVKPGMRVAIVGPTGCGKTTLINLLMRFYDVQNGAISIDDTDISKVTRHSLRHGFGMVLQDTWIKAGTVRENICIGKPDASEDEIIEAAKRSHSLSFIRRLPDGLDTMLHEDSLSQGQRQLLCITRVMLALPPMLILDEATSSIDTRTELKIQEAFDRLMQGRTSFIVAHRLSTIQNADLILVMKEGKIIEQGTHTSLIENDGFYKTLYQSQFANVTE